MSFQNGAPGTEITEKDESQYVVGASTSVGGMLGITERGIPGVAKRVKNWAEYQASFGKQIAASLLPDVAKRALDGGCSLYISRATALTDDVSDAVAASVVLQTPGGGASAGKAQGNVAGALWQGVYTWPFQAGQKLGWKEDGGGEKGPIVFAATPATKQLSNVATFALADNETILYKSGPSYDPGPVRTLTLHAADFANIAAATPTELAKVLARDMVGVRVDRVANQITLNGDILGTNSRLEFTGGTALAALGLLVEVLVGGGNVGDIDHVTAAELTALIAGLSAGVVFSVDANHFAVLARATSGAAHSVQVTNSDGNETAGAAVLGWDNAVHAGTSNNPVNTLTITAGQGGLPDPGTWANGATGGLTVDTANATLNPADRFRLTVKRGGVVKADEDELSLDPADTRYVVKVFANSGWIVVEDENAQGTVGTYAAARPAVAAGNALAGGDDGLAGIGDSDYIGDSAAKTGLYSFDAVKDVSFIGSPGNVSRTFLGELFDYCETRQDCVGVGDVPLGLTPSQGVDFRQATGAYAGGSAFDSTYGALYDVWPQIQDAITKLPKFIPPMGEAFVAYATTDTVENVWRAPAGPNRGLLGAGLLGLSAYRDLESDVGQLYSAGINVIVNHPKFGFMINGQKTLAATPSDLDRINVRRGFIYLRVSIKPTIEQAAEFEPNDAITWRSLKRKVEPFLEQQVKLRGLNAFNFKVDASNNPPDDVQAHKLTAQLFVQPTPAAEFIEVSLIDVGPDVNLNAQ